MDYRFISNPVQLYWMGWKTDTATLAEEGWDISVDQNPARRTMQIAIRKEWERLKLYGISEVHEFNYDYWLNNGGIGSEMFHMKMAENIQFNGYTRSENFNAVNAFPSIVKNIKSWNIENMCHFQKLPKQTKEILLHKASLDQVLEFALSKQAPEQERIRKEMIKRKELEKYKQASEVKAELRMVI